MLKDNTSILCPNSQIQVVFQLIMLNCRKEEKKTFVYSPYISTLLLENCGEVDHVIEELEWLKVTHIVTWLTYITYDCILFSNLTTKELRQEAFDQTEDVTWPKEDITWAFTWLHEIRPRTHQRQLVPYGQYRIQCIQTLHQNIIVMKGR